MCVCVCKIKINIQCNIADTFYTPNKTIWILSGVCVNTSEDEIIKNVGAPRNTASVPSVGEGFIYLSKGKNWLQNITWPLIYLSMT